MSDELKPRASVDTPEFRAAVGRLLDSYDEYDESKPVSDVAREAWVALIAHIDAWRVPAGYKLVPIDSTAEMVRAGGNMLRACGNDQATTRDAELCWSAMLDAAPDKEPPCGS